MKTQKIKVILGELDVNGFHLFVSVKINGKRCRFLIDTGASKSAVDKSFYLKYIADNKLKTIQQETTGLHSSTSESYLGKIKLFEIGRYALKNLIMAAVDLSHVNMTYKKLHKPRIDGILGSDLMLHFKMVLDYGKMTLEIPA